jgi:hypothetical protein
MSWDNKNVTYYGIEDPETELTKHRIHGYDGSTWEYYVDPKNKGFSEWLDRLNEYSEYLEPSFPAEEEEEARAADHMLEPYV